MTDRLYDALGRFDDLPDDAILPTKTTALITGLSERSIRYHPSLPRHQISQARYGQRVGDVRRLCREGFRPIGEAARRVVDGIDHKNRGDR